MTTPSSVDTIRLEAQRLAAAESWPAVAALLAPLFPDALQDGDLVLLYAEARWRSGEQRDVLEWLPDVVRTLAAGENRAAHRRALNMLGAASLAVGQLEDASARFGQVLELSTEVDDPLMMAQATNNLGAIANLRGQHQLALWHYRIALPTLQRIGDQRRIAESYHNFAITCRDLGELEEADEHERRAIDYASDAVSPRVAAMGRVGRAEIALRRGDAPFAEMTASLAAAEFARLADPQNESDALRLVGAARTALGRTDEALDAFARALALAESRGHALNQAEVLRDRVEAWVQRQDLERAAADARRAMELFRGLGATAEVERLEKRLGSLG